MTELVTHNEDRPGPKGGGNGSKARADGVELVSGNQLSRHLGISRQAVDGLAAQRVIVRRSDGFFDQDAARLAYIGHLRTERRGSARSQADAAFTAAKTKLIELRVMERERDLIPIVEALETTDRLVGIMLTHMGSMPARVAGRDLALRRKVEQVVFEVRTEISEAASAMGDAAGEPKEEKIDA